MNQALAAGLDVFRRALGSSLASNLAIRSGGRLYADGNTLEADQQAGGSLGLEAVNKQGVLIASRVEWVGVSGTGSRASVSLERAVRQAVVLKANEEEVRLTVEVKAGSTKEQLLAALDELVFEVLNELIANNQKKRDSLQALQAADERIINEKADKIIALRNSAVAGTTAGAQAGTGTVIGLSSSQQPYHQPVSQAMRNHTDYGPYIQRRDNTLKLLKSLRFLYANKEIIITLLKPGAIPALIREIENDAGSLAVGVMTQLIRGDRSGIKAHLTAYLIDKIATMAQQQVAND